MVHLNYKRFRQMRIKLFTGTAVDVKTIPDQRRIGLFNFNVFCPKKSNPAQIKS